MRVLVILALAFGPVFTDVVAAKCAGEASFAVEACACTVKNRLQAGWSASRVLEAYYAPSVSPSPSQRFLTASVLNGETHCSPEYYYLFSKSDSRYLGLDTDDAAGAFCAGERCVFAFPKTALGGKK